MSAPIQWGGGLGPSSPLVAGDYVRLSLRTGWGLTWYGLTVTPANVMAEQIATALADSGLATPVAPALLPDPGSALAVVLDVRLRTGAAGKPGAALASAVLAAAGTGELAAITRISRVEAGAGPSLDAAQRSAQQAAEADTIGAGLSRATGAVARWGAGTLTLALVAVVVVGLAWMRPPAGRR